MATAKKQNNGFRGLQNYTTLKLFVLEVGGTRGFRGLQNYTTLKLLPIPIIVGTQF